MLQSKQYSESWYLLDSHVFSSLHDVLRKYVRELLLLLVPEDTTDNGAYGRRVRSVEVSNARSTAKVVFWVVIAITLSLCIGQLK